MGYEMKHSKTPSAWAKLRAHAYRLSGIAIIPVILLAQFGILPLVLADLLLSVLVLAALAANATHVFAILTGDQQKQQTEGQAWKGTAVTVQNGFRWARQFWTPDRNHPLREVGAIGLNLARFPARIAGRQPGGSKTGAGGHKKPASSGSDDEGEGEPPAHLPLIWTTHDLAATLAVSAKTLQNQPPHHLPPAIRIPGCRGPRYRLQDVMAWLDGFSAEQRPARPLPRKVRGRPRIALSLGNGGVA